MEQPESNPKKVVSKKKLACTKCGLIGNYAMQEVQHIVKTESIEFLLMTLSSCNHEYVIRVLDEAARDKKEKTEDMRNKIKLFVASGDLSGVVRYNKKHKAAQLAYQDAIRYAWDKHKDLIDGAIPAFDV